MTGAIHTPLGRESTAARPAIRLPLIKECRAAAAQVNLSKIKSLKFLSFSIRSESVIEPAAGLDGFQPEAEALR